MNSFARIVAGGLMLGIVAGCSPATESDDHEVVDPDLVERDVVGRYVLSSIGGNALPVALPLSGPPRYILVADTLWLRADSTYEQHTMRKLHGPAPLFLVGDFRVTGTTIWLTLTGRLDQPPSGSPAAAVAGRVGRLRITVGTSPSSEMVYTLDCTGADC